MADEIKVNHQYLQDARDKIWGQAVLMRASVGSFGSSSNIFSSFVGRAADTQRLALEAMVQKLTNDVDQLDSHASRLGVAGEQFSATDEALSSKIGG